MVSTVADAGVAVAAMAALPEIVKARAITEISYLCMILPARRESSEPPLPPDPVRSVFLSLNRIFLIPSVVLKILPD